VFKGNELMRAAAAVVAACAAASCIAQGVPGVWMTVDAASSCGRWVAVRTDTKSLRSVQAAAFIIGYLSGLTRERATHPLDGRDHESVLLFIDKHCRDNPFSNPVEAADALVKAR